ncbi:MAG: DUF1349 domain-containing protein [Pseudomonadota bacterium]
MGKLKQVLSTAQWHAEPPSWDLTDAELSLTTGAKTDFWQNTFYGFRRDDGHFLGQSVSGDFTAVVGFEADYQVLYDQAGMMVRADDQTWLKAGIEYSDDVTNFSTVVTRNGQSDWSVIGVPQLSGLQRVRVTRTDSSVITHYLDRYGHWQLMRLANFPESANVVVGPMACSPERTGLTVRFHEFQIGPPLQDPLHATL